MSSLTQAVRWLWALSILGQLAVPAVLFWKGNFRKLPFFTTCAVLNLCQAALLVALYYFPHTIPGDPQGLAWASELIILLAQAAATLEVLGITLKPYPGIWGLGWRALAVAASIVIALVALAARGQWQNAHWFELNRGYHLTSATAVAACLLLVRYYGIPVHIVYKLILLGFCFYSCTEILINTVLEALLRHQFSTYQPVWQFATMFSFVVVEGIWLVALLRRFPPPQSGPPDHPTGTYERLSPEINEQLHHLDDKLKRFWKNEENPQ